MAWPSTLTTFTDPLATNKLNAPSHSSIETAQNTALEELQTFIGVNTGVNASTLGTLLYDVKSPNSDGGGHIQTANKGGTGQTLFAKGDLLVASSSSVLSKLTIGSNGQVPIADSNASSGIRWGSSADNTTFIPAGVGGSPAGFSDKASIAGSAANSGAVAVWAFNDGVESAVIMGSGVPTGFTGISSIKAVIVGDGIGGEAYLKFNIARMSSGSASVGAVNVVGMASNSVFAIQPSSSVQQLAVPLSAFAGVSLVTAGDIIQVQMIRTAGNAADTHNTTLELAGYIVKWK